MQVGNDKNSIVDVPDSSTVPVGCDSLSLCQGNPCNSNAQCINEWEGYRCECPPGKYSSFNYTLTMAGTVRYHILFACFGILEYSLHSNLCQISSLIELSQINL